MGDTPACHRQLRRFGKDSGAPGGSKISLLPVLQCLVCCSTLLVQLHCVLDISLYNMRIRPQTQPVGIVSGVKGSKTTFADDSGDDAGLADAPQAGPSRPSNARPSIAQDDEDDNDDDDNDDDDDDDDDAPEAVGLAQGKESRVEEEQREAE